LFAQHNIFRNLSRFANIHPRPHPDWVGRGVVTVTWVGRGVVTVNWVGRGVVTVNWVGRGAVTVNWVGRVL
jgi:hypothetical protein